MDTATAGEHGRLADRSPELTPSGWHDLRSTRAAPVTVLRYPAGSAVVVGGVPGAGKSTLLHRVLGTDGTERVPAELPGGAVVLDSEQARNRWRDRFGTRTPYPLYRPVVHLVHNLAMIRALLGEGGVVIHDCATRGWWRAMVLTAARRRPAGAHLLVLDVPAGLALDGQRRRGRTVRRGSFARHVRRSRQLVSPDPTGAGRFASCVVLDRGAADRLTGIELDSRVPRRSNLSAT
jgi:hypothetical protein